MSLEEYRALIKQAPQNLTEKGWQRLKQLKGQIEGEDTQGIEDMDKS